MKKFVVALIVLLCCSSAFACIINEPTCVTCPAGPAGPAGAVGPAGPTGPAGKDGVGINGQNGRDGADGVGRDGRDGRDGKDAIFDDAKYDAGLSGTMAMSQLDHARQGGSVASVGLATYEGESALAVGVGKSWKLSGPNVNEVVLGVAGFVGSSNTTGAAASVGIHFGQKN